jgi:hypothetical protein
MYKCNIYVERYMSEREPEPISVKHFSPHEDLINYMSQRLKLNEAMEKAHAAGEEFSIKINSQDKSLRTKKTRILDDIVFPSLADLVFFFEAIAADEELQVRFKNDIEDLLGIRQNRPQEYGFMLIRLLRSILVIQDTEAKETAHSSEYDFRLRLNHIIQGIVFDKVIPSLMRAFKTYKAQSVVRDDFHRAWAWTGMLAYNVVEDGEPNRTFNFDTGELLK